MRWDPARMEMKQRQHHADSRTILGNIADKIIVIGRGGEQRDAETDRHSALQFSQCVHWRMKCISQ